MVPSMMKAITVDAFGGIDQLKSREQPTPAVTSGQALVQVEAAGVGLADVFMRRGSYPGKSPGYIAGFEAAGTIVDVAGDCDRTRIGERVFAFTRAGAYAEYILANLASLYPIPHGVNSADVVAIGINGMVAECALRRADVQPNERVLIRGAAGGIGVIATQLAARRGAIVAITASSDERRQRLVDYGATDLLDRDGRTRDGETATFDVVVDIVAGSNTPRFLDMLRDNGRLVICGVAGGFPEPSFALGILAGFARSLTISALSLDSFDNSYLQLVMSQLLASAASGGLRPVVASTLPLENAIDAHRELETGNVFGKLILQP